MKTKAIVITLCVVVVGYIISNPLVLHLCKETYVFNGIIGCSDESIKTLGSPLLIFSLFVLLTNVVVAFLPEKFFFSWLKFALWAVPIAVVLIWLTPVYSSNMYIDIFSFTRDDAARLAGEVFSGASLGLIIWKWFHTRRSA